MHFLAPFLKFVVCGKLTQILSHVFVPNEFEIFFVAILPSVFQMGPVRTVDELSSQEKVLRIVLKIHFGVEALVMQKLFKVEKRDAGVLRIPEKMMLFVRFCERELERLTE